MLLLFMLSSNNAFSQAADFRVQHIQDDVARSGGINSSFSAVSSLNNAIELANNNRKTHAGPSGNENNHAGEDMAGGRQLTNTNTLTYYREANSVNRDMRFNTSIWEYVGPANGRNEIIVRGRYAVNLNGTNNSVIQAVSGIVNVDKCIPFITGIMNNATAQDADSATAIAYLEDSTTLRVQKGSNANNVRVYITLVEFTGTNWSVLHGDSGNVSSDSGTIRLRNGSDGTGAATNVSSWNEAIIFSQFRADINASGTNDALSDLWPVTEPGNNNQRVDWTFHSNHDSAGTNRHFVHVLVNSDLNVTRFQNTSNNSGERTINITSAGLTDVNQAFIIGASRTSGNGTAYGRGWRNYYLNSTTEAAHWSHRSGNGMAHEIQIVDLSDLQTLEPEINVQYNTVDIPSGNTVVSLVDGTDFGSVEIAGALSLSHTFRIQNLGDSDLTLSDPSPYVTLTGDTSDFTLTANPNATIAGGAYEEFTITYDPTTSGLHSVTISIASTDSDESLYTFRVQGIGQYCNSEGNLNWDTSITNVTFNTINNSDNEIPKDNNYEDFTNIETNLYKGSTHNLSVRVNTDGNWTVYTNAWIDWNRDGDFDDPGEEYDMGVATNVVDGLTSNSLMMDITVPIGASIGTSRMRVASKYSSHPSSCESGYDGEVEDYSVNIIDYFIDFDGVDDYIDFSDNHDLSNAFSIESWVYQENTVTTGTILSKGNIDASLQSGYHLSLKNNFPNLIWFDNSNNEVLNVTSPYDIPNNEWHHVAVTYDGALVTMYIDGIVVASVSPPSGLIDNSQNFKIGADLENFSTTPLEMNYFDGAIQEVRIWDVALTEAQIREMMNQHIEQNSPSVRGSITKTTISGGVLWANLLGYYPLNSNTALDSSSYNIDGIPNNIDTSQITTAPLPYETDADSSWDTSTTWLNSSDLYIPNTIGIDGTTPIDWNIVELTNNINSGSRDIYLNGLISLLGTLTIDGTTNMTTGIGSGQSLTISHYLELDGVIDLNGESQLIQLEGSIVDDNSGGYLTRDQQGTANAFNYNYWSSSVGSIGGDISTRGNGVSAINQNYTISGVLNDGTNASAYQNLMFSTAPSIGGSIPPPGLARTISTYWLYKFYGAANSYNAWGSINESSSILAGEGFTMKGTLESVSVSDMQNYVFEGLPNNGDIELPLNKISGTGNVDRLIGNPYPSAIDATEFILDNMSIAHGGNNTNGTVFNGALYFWDHFGQQNSHNLSGYVGGYATRNLTGGAIAISNDSRINDNFNSGTKVPGQYIAVNQGFFVSTALDGFNDDNGVPILTVDGGDIVFKNRQRVFAIENTSTSLFFKSSNTKKTNSSAKIDVNETPTIKLMYNSPLGYHRQIVVGVKEKASNKFDLGYDAFMADVNIEDMYWLFDNNKFVIQGVNNFESPQELALGLIVKKSGLASIKIDVLENIDPNKAIYISDAITGEVSEINSKPFEIYLEKGTYNDRFKLVFQKNDQSLQVDEFENSNNLLVFYDSKVSKLKIFNNDRVYTSRAKLYNILGQSIMELDINSTNDVEIPLSVKTGAYIVKLKTDLGIISKKIVVE
ncbi:LamG-like jellyroll fold domain-containing protein [Thalassobellus sediminis]|uniref:LamG-like jellyroll fold domain-containing protein n=1 Tax=Thalassobellus sediminis TaxID=3367753 RepID=UPI003791AC75